MIKRITLLLSVLITITGCGTMTPPDSYYNAQAARATAAGTAAAQPLLRITGGFQCAETGGENGACTIEVFDPRAHESIARIERGTTGADVAIKGLETIGGYVITRALREVGTKTYNVSNEGDGGLTFNNDTHTTELTSSSIDGTQAISGDTSGDVTGDTSGDHTSQQYADSYNVTDTATTNTSTDNSNQGNTEVAQ